MNFCATCGRQRTGEARFCSGCGTEFPAAAATPAGQPAVAVPPDAAGPEATAQSTGAARREPPTGPSEWTAADATRVERQPDATRIDVPGAGPAAAPVPAAPAPDPFASWFASDPPAGQTAPSGETPGQWQQTPGPWQAADTVYAAPGQRAPGYPPQASPYGSQPPPYGGQPAPRPGGGRSSGGRRAAFIVVVALVMLAAGGGAYALVSRSNNGSTTQPPAPTVTASSSATGAASASASASAAPSASSSASASATATAGLVRLGPGVASNPAAPAVETTLTHYFQGINTHNYDEYASSLDPQERAAQPQSQFAKGYQSTSDSGMELVALTSASGGLEATVTFVSHQAAGTGVDGSSCNNWKLTFYLVQQGAGYLKGAAPSGYQPSYSDC